MGFTWSSKRPSEILPQGADAVDEAVAAAVQKLALYFGPQVESWMKQNAPWEDRTGNLRQALHVETEALVNGAALYLIQGLDYGVFLELSNGGTYAVIGPALDHWIPEIWASVEQLLRG